MLENNEVQTVDNIFHALDSVEHHVVQQVLFIKLSKQQHCRFLEPQNTVAPHFILARLVEPSIQSDRRGDSLERDGTSEGKDLHQSTAR